MEYPEHEKLKSVQIESNAIGQFLEWMREGGYYVAEYKENGSLYPSYKSINDLIAEYLGIDQKKLEEEKREILQTIKQKTN